MSVDEKIAKKKKVLNRLVRTLGVMSKRTLKVSQELDVLIVERMRGALV
jgi:hypothetical protein